jgi:osmoprotectant transport system substrate-binding protein
MSAMRSVRMALLVLLALGSAGCSAFGFDTAPEPAAHRGSAIVVGVSGDFAENQLVAEMYAQVLEHAGYDVRREFNLHSRESSQNALESGTIDVKPEYLSSLLLFVDPNAKASEDPAEVAAQLRERLGPRGVTLLAPARAQDTNQFVASAETAKRYHLTSMSSLAPVAGSLTLGGPPECPQRAFCLPGLKSVYGIVFNDFQAVDVGGPTTIQALLDDEVQVGLMFSTDPRISENGFIPLVDDRHLQDAENITPVMRSDKVNAEIRALLDGVSARLNDGTLTSLVGRVVIDGEEIPAVARGWLTANGLL